MTSLLGQLDELAGLHHAPLGMTPPHQRLKPGHLPAGQVHDRLVDQAELGVLHRVFQRRPHLAAPDHPSRQDRLVPAPLPLAGRLGRVQGQVRVPQQLIGVSTVLRSRHPDRGRGQHRPLGQRERLAERLDNALSERIHRGRIRDVLDEYRELVAAQPRRHIGVSHDRGKPGPGRHEQFVADAMAHRVVHDLEVVQVHE